MSEQSMEALAKANVAKQVQQTICGRVHSGELKASDVLATVPEGSQGLTLFKLLTAMKHYGWDTQSRSPGLKIRRIVQKANARENQRLDELTDRQRLVIVEALREKGL